MTAEELKGAAEVLGRLAASLHEPGSDGYVRIRFKHEFFNALQHLLQGTEWHERFCWETSGGGDAILAVNVKPRPIKYVCKTCKGKGYVEK